MDPDDFLSELFGSGFSFEFGAPGARKPKQQQDSVIDYEVTLEDLYKGKHVKMNMEKDVLCSVCHG